MAQSWQQDPKTGDYVIEKGVPVQTDSLTAPALIRLKTPLGGYMYQRRMGSEFFNLRKKRSANDPALTRNIAERCLKPLLDDGRALEIAAETEDNFRYGTQLKVSILSNRGRLDQINIPSIGV